jgi:2'-5' RNA ligase
MEQIRSFIAIELPEPVIACIKQVQGQLISAGPACAKWVDPRNIHLTLKFLGNIDVNKIQAITAAMQSSARTIASFKLTLDGLGAFPNLRRVQVVWIGLGGDLGPLLALQTRLESALAPLGFIPEKRAFQPHLTLARIRENATPLERQELGENITRTQFDSNLVINVNSFNLMRSELTRAGAVYTRLCSVELTPSCQ